MRLIKLIMNSDSKLRNKLCAHKSWPFSQLTSMYLKQYIILVATLIAFVEAASINEYYDMMNGRDQSSEEFDPDSKCCATNEDCKWYERCNSCNECAPYVNWKFHKSCRPITCKSFIDCPFDFKCKQGRCVYSFSGTGLFLGSCAAFVAGLIVG